MSIPAKIKQYLKIEVSNPEQFENLSYQWLRNDVPIDGATSDTYELQFEDYLVPDRMILKSITCQVSGDVDVPDFILKQLDR